MYVSEVTSKPRIVDGKKFVETTVKGEYRGKSMDLTTIYMNDKPIIKTWKIQDGEKTINLWYAMKELVKERALRKNRLNVIV